MANRLANENSPYLLQHADNPVDWFPWSSEALERAQREDKPIFLSIGYAACHWCHVMAHESFEDKTTADLMNRYFVNIKVDREERPDLDSIYMSAVVAMTGHGGWPMSVFLTPAGQPFFGGTYFPPARRYNLPSFQDVLQSVARLWRDDRERLLHSSNEITQHLLSAQLTDLPFDLLDTATLNSSALGLAQTYDWKYGGWGGAPKFPQPMVIEFLLRRAGRGDKLALDIATHALDAMARGGMYDVIGGGFSRYSTDNRWLVPHFEKMLYDNAQLARVYLHAFMLRRKPAYQQVCVETLDFLATEMLDPAGGLYSSLDADSEGQEGKYYLWDFEEVRTALSELTWSEKALDPAQFFIAAYAITPSGNFEGRTVLQRALTDEQLAEQFGLTAEQISPLLSEIHAALRRVRDQRVRPATDNKVLVAWNALALIAFSEAARYLNRNDYLEKARNNARFILKYLYQEGHLFRSWRNGQARHTAYLEDYASLIRGLISLYQSDPDPRWYRSAFQLTEEMVQHFLDPNGGFYDTRDDHDTLLLRPKNIQDNATPSGSSLAAQALLEMAHYTGKSEWREMAEEMLGKIQTVALRHPTAFANWLNGLDFAILPSREVAILGGLRDENTLALKDALWSSYRMDLLAAISDYPPPADTPELLQNRSLSNGRPTAYVCKDFVCSLPVNTPQELLLQLEQKL